MSLVVVALATIAWLIIAAWATLLPFLVGALLAYMFLYVYRRFGDPPRPAGVLPGDPMPASVAADTGSSATTAEPSSARRG